MHSPLSRCPGSQVQCRQRHVKCDQNRPYCHVCLRNGRVCAGYERHVIFDTDKFRQQGKVRTQLFTQDEQRWTSDQLVASMPVEAVSKHIQDIDSLIEVQEISVDGQTTSQITRGPFKAFRLNAPAPPWVDLDLWMPLDIDLGLIPSPSPPNQDTTNIPPDDDALCVNPVTAFMSDFILPAESVTELMNDMLTNQWVEDEALLEHPSYLIDGNTHALSLVRPSFSNVAEPVPQEAPFLLNHYLETVTNSLTPVPDAKSPWRLLFFAHAKDAFATMALARAPDHASLSVFYAVLAISSFTHRTVSTSQRWHHLANIYRRRAEFHLRQTWSEAFCVPKRAKYKTLLMALLTMIHVSAFAEDPDTAERYLLDAEKFVRICGLTKFSKSYRVRLLHHCYSFPRIFYESTYVLVTKTSRLRNTPPASESSRGSSSDQGSPRFKLGGWCELNEIMEKIKSKEKGETDLHLEHPGFWSDTLYPDVFGIPESVLVLLSQTIALGNERAAAEGEIDDSPRLSWKEFLSRARSLETCILCWKHRTLEDHLSWDPRLGIESASIDRQYVVRNMLEALCEALSIYFYRRVYNIHPSSLQERVRAVRDSLLRCDQSAQSVNYTAGFTWSAFIAASEATDANLQSSFTSWFEARINHIGWPCFGKMLKVVKKVWCNNRDHVDWTSWPEVLQAEDLRFFYA